MIGYVAMMKLELWLGEATFYQDWKAAIQKWSKDRRAYQNDYHVARLNMISSRSIRNWPDREVKKLIAVNTSWRGVQQDDIPRDRTMTVLDESAH